MTSSCLWNVIDDNFMVCDWSIIIFNQIYKYYKQVEKCSNAIIRELYHIWYSL